VICALHLSPHPDDEVMGAGATLLGLRAAGHRVINLACGLGRPEQHERRRAEVQDACERAGFELVVHDPPLHMSRGDDLTSVTVSATRAAARIVADEGVSLLISPAPEDAHPAHGAIARAAREVAEQAGLRWWAWGLWRDLEAPTLYSGFGEERLAALQQVLLAHGGEIERNDFPALLRARAVAARVLGAERVWGFGSPGRDDAYAELLTEWVPDRGRLVPGTPRSLDPAVPFGVFDLQAPGS
jgi:LmbE family N-acetylglucosaminyl deacetylase